MSKKDTVLLTVALIIFAVTGMILYTQILAPKGAAKAKSVTVEVVQPINPDYNSKGLSDISDSRTATDFYRPVDLNSGVGNSRPFGPF